MYSIFTNIYTHNPNKHAPRMANRFKVYHAATIDDARQLKSTIENDGHKVTSIKTALGRATNI